MNLPCPIAIHCGDYPFANVSAEGVEYVSWKAIGYCCDTTLRQATSIISQDDADLTLQRLLTSTCPDCDKEREFCARANCPDGSNLTEICVPSSQADADALAAAAAAAMLPFCDNKEELFEATCTCPDGVSDPHTTRSNISQEVADAECEVIPKVCPGAFSAGGICTVQCPDGSPFTYILPPGSVTAPTQAEADALAHQIACERAKELKFCLDPIAPCACVNVAYTALIKLSYGTRPVTFAIVSGALPPTFSFGQTSNGFLIGGTPTATGNYAFEIRATDATGSYVQKQYFLNIIGITTTTVPDYTVGTPYSLQLTGAGGSGNYSWTIQSGALPDGLTLSSSGLISGTPTGLDAGSPVTFSLVDLACQQEERSLFPPKVTLSTRSTTRIATRHGWKAFDGTDVFYRSITYAGEAEQKLYVRFPTSDNSFYWSGGLPLTRWYQGKNIPTYPTDNFCTAVRVAQAKYVWSGTSSINNAGNLTATHLKQLYGLCPTDENDIPFYTYQGYFNEAGNPVFLLDRYGLIGYCWELDSKSCNPCMEEEGGVAPLYFIRNESTASSDDWPHKFVPWGATAIENVTQTTRHATGTPDPLMVPWSTYRTLRDSEGNLIHDSMLPRSPYLFFDWDNLSLAVIEVQGTRDFSATLSDPFTYAEAYAAAQMFTSNSKIASTQVDVLRWGGVNAVQHAQSRYVSVAFTLTCKNLIVGASYTVSWQYRNMNTNAVTTISQTFDATEQTQEITGTIPTPANGVSVKIENPRIIQN